jgi:hypothetical protein
MFVPRPIERRFRTIAGLHLAMMRRPVFGLSLGTCKMITADQATMLLAHQAIRNITIGPLRRHGYVARPIP